MSDLVKQLREGFGTAAGLTMQVKAYHGICQKAADEIDRLRKDEVRLDWLSDKNQMIGVVQLPKVCVMRNLHSLRSAIDDAIAMHGATDEKG